MPRLIRGLEFKSPREGVKQFVENIRNVLDKTFGKLVTQQMCQAVKANRHCQEGQGFSVRDLVFLSMENLSLPKGRAHKLLPKYLGPYKVLVVNHSSSTYKVEVFTLPHAFHVDSQGLLVLHQDSRGTPPGLGLPVLDSTRTPHGLLVVFCN